MHAQSPVFVGNGVFQDKFSILLTKFLLLKDCTPVAFHITEVIYFAVTSLENVAISRMLLSQMVEISGQE